MLMTQVVRQIEELSLNAWPCLETVCHDGWVLRFADGYTRRANSVNAIYPSTGDLFDNVAYCESVYTRKGLRTVFKMTPAVLPPDLDDVLAERGYVKDAPTSVQTVKLDDVATPELNTVVIEQDLSDAWLSVFCRLNNVDGYYLPAMKQMLTRIVPRTCFIRLKVQDQVAAVALAVLDGDYVGIFDVVTAAHLRNRGLGRELMLNVMQWGKTNGAQVAYLQVMLDNPPALHLYQKLGFREVYPYWYRVKDLR
jgi:ribosomal protein S18 acetylase RimI-like enzyme